MDKQVKIIYAVLTCILLTGCNKQPITSNSLSSSIEPTSSEPVSSILVKENTLENKYEFVGWEPSIAPVSDNVVYKAVCDIIPPPII